MNSFIEVSPKIIAILGAVNDSEFKLNQLRQSIQLENEEDIGFQEIYFCLLNKDISRVTKKESQELFGLLNASDNQIFSAISFFLITPRIGTCLLYTSPSPRDQ